MSEPEVLTVPVALTIGDILNATIGNKLVTILEVDGRISVGTARAIVAPDSMGFHRGDVRDGRLWLTMRLGFEHCIPVLDVISGVQAGTIALDFDGG